MRDDNGKVKFDSKIIRSGNSLYLRIPPEILDYLQAEKDTEMKIQSEHGEYGPYISAWNPEQQDKGGNK